MNFFMGRTCFIPNCRTGYKSRKGEIILQKYSLFSVPKDENLFNMWKTAIPRSDRPLDNKITSYKLFQLLASIESVILDYCSTGDIMKNDSFLDILYSLCLEELPQVGCDDHRQEVMVNLIYDFMVTRFKCVARNSKRESLEKKRAASHSKKKQY